MTTTGDQLRGLILAALMVLSVAGGTIAFSGAGAADYTGGTLEADITIGGANDNATITTVGDPVTVEVDTSNFSADTTITVQHVYSGVNKTVNASLTTDSVTFEAAKDDGQDSVDQTAVVIYTNGSELTRDYYTTQNYLVKTTSEVLWGSTSTLTGKIYEYYNSSTDNALEDDINVDYAVYNPAGTQVAQGDTSSGQFVQSITFDYLNSSTQDKDYPADSQDSPAYVTYVREDPLDNNPGAGPNANNGSDTTRVLVDASVSTDPSNLVYGDTANVSGSVQDGLGNALAGYPVEVRSGDNPVSKIKGTDTAGDGTFLFTMTFDDAGTWEFGTNRSGFIQYDTIEVASAQGNLSIVPDGQPANFNNTWTVTFTDQNGDPVNTGGDVDSFVNLTVNFDASENIAVSGDGGSAVQVNPDNDGVIEYIHINNTTADGQVEITGTPVGSEGSEISGDAQWEETTRDTPETPDVVASGSASLATAGDFVVVDYDIQDEVNSSSAWTSIDMDNDNEFGDGADQTVRVLPLLNSDAANRTVSGERVGNDSNYALSGITDYRVVLDLRNASNVPYEFDKATGSNITSISVMGAGINKTISSASHSDYSFNTSGANDHFIEFKPLEKASPDDQITVMITTESNGQFTQNISVAGLRIDSFEVDGQQVQSVPVGTTLNLTSVVTEADGTFVNNGKVRVSQNTTSGLVELAVFDARTQNTNDGEYNFTFTVDTVAMDTNGDGVAETDAPLTFTAYQYTDADNDQALEQDEVTEATVRTIEVTPKSTIQVDFISNEEHEYLGADGGNLTAGVRYDNITVQLTRDGQPVNLRNGVNGTTVAWSDVEHLLTIEGHNVTIDSTASDPANGTYVITEIKGLNGEAVDAQYDDTYIAFNGSHIGESIEVNATTPDKSYSTAADEDSFEVVAPVVEEEVTKVTNNSGATVNVSDVETMTAGIGRTYTVEATVMDQAGVPINGTSDDIAKVVITLEDGTSKFIAATGYNLIEHDDNGEQAAASNVASWSNWKFPVPTGDARHILTQEGDVVEGNLMMSSNSGGIDENGTFTFLVQPTNADDLVYLVSQNADGEETDGGSPEYGVDLDNDGDVYDNEEYEAPPMATAEDSGLSAESPIVNVFDVSGGVIPEQNFATTDQKRLVGPTGLDDNGIVVPKGVTDKVRIEVFPADTDDAALPSIYIGLESGDPVSESGVWTLTDLETSGLASNFTQGQVGQIEFTPTGSGEDVIEIRWSFDNSSEVTSGNADVVEYIDVAQSTDTLNLTVDTQDPAAGDTVVGTVYDETGDPVSDARVYVTFPDGNTMTLTTDAAGQYSFNASQTGDYELSSVRVGYEPSAQLQLATGEPANFQVSNLQAPANVTAGQNVTVTATIENTGGAQATQTVEFRFNGTTLATKSVTLASGASTTVEFTISTDGVAPGTYTHGVFSADDSMTAQITVEQADAGPGALPGFDNAPKDPDDDGVYEDVNGDGTVNIADVQALFANRNSQVVQNNPGAFDVNKDGAFNIADVQALFAQITS